jgi:hypothetical protein
MIAKPGRRDLASPRAWRPVSLLCCLGKGLERLIARLLAWAAIHYHPQPLFRHNPSFGKQNKKSFTKTHQLHLHKYWPK